MLYFKDTPFRRYLIYPSQSRNECKEFSARSNPRPKSCASGANREVLTHHRISLPRYVDGPLSQAHDDKLAAVRQMAAIFEGVLCIYLPRYHVAQLHMTKSIKSRSVQALRTRYSATPGKTPRIWTDARRAEF